LGRRAVAAATFALLALSCERAALPPVSAAVPPPGEARPELPPDDFSDLSGVRGLAGGLGAEDETEVLRAELAAARARIARLEIDAQRAAAERIAREEEWLRYSKALSQLAAAGEKPASIFQPMPESASDEPAAKDASGRDSSGRSPEEIAEAAKHDRAIFVSLRSLLSVEQVTSYDLLESGTLSPEGFTGPVVLRALDERGRPIGTIAAARLHLEGSRAARSMTIVLENGYEKRGGESFPFTGPSLEPGRGGIRRIDLPAVDPSPWIEPLAAIFRAEDRAPPADDGLWDLGTVRAALNLLLREDVTGGWWRLAGLGGIEAGVLRDVQLDQLDATGRLERKLFADRMTIVEQEQGVKVELQDGAQLRGDAKTPFLDGRYRIFLPRASAERWRKAGLPGLAPPPPKQKS
jgi:hypothetical protein